MILFSWQCRTNNELSWSVNDMIFSCMKKFGVIINTLSLTKQTVLSMHYFLPHKYINTNLNDDLLFQDFHTQHGSICIDLGPIS